MWLTYTRTFYGTWKIWPLVHIPLKRFQIYWGRFKLPYVPPILCCLLWNLTFPVQIDKLNLEGYANLENWVAELDKRIEKILLQRLRSIIQVWCAEFDRNEDGESKRESIVPVLPNVRDVGGKRRSGKSGKEEKVCGIIFLEKERTFSDLECSLWKRIWLWNLLCMRFGFRIKSFSWIRRLNMREQLGSSSCMIG